MTIEQKAAAYDKALEAARESFNYPDYPGFIRADVVFPELKESEDERIRKEILDYFQADFAKQEGITRPDWITWLEKQKPVTNINPRELDTRLNQLIKQFESLPRQELINSLNFYLNVVKNDGKFIEFYNTSEWNAVDIGYLYNWYQDSVDEKEEPVWTYKHIEELFNDFYLIPKKRRNNETLGRKNRSRYTR